MKLENNIIALKDDTGIVSLHRIIDENKSIELKCPYVPPLVIPKQINLSNQQSIELIHKPCSSICPHMSIKNDGTNNYNVQIYCSGNIELYKLISILDKS